jgi:hypothetical protein
VTSVLPLLISAAAYVGYQFRTCLENQFNKNLILLVQKMFLSFTRSYGLSVKKRERERDKVPVFVPTFLDVLLEEEGEPLKFPH